MMENLRVFIILFCLTTCGVLSAPVPEDNNDDFCAGDELLKYAIGTDYRYDYTTETKLWINDVSDEAKSTAVLSAQVSITRLSDCTFVLKLHDSKLTGESFKQNDQSVSEILNAYSAVFRMNSNGELDENVRFEAQDKPWSRNVKRAIISAFQLKSESSLRLLNENDDREKSAVVYETDILGRCRTTYELLQDETYSSGKTLALNKKKSLQRCTLNSNSKTSAIQYLPYKSQPEFYQGRLFIESFECDVNVKDNVVSTVECKEKSTYKIGSHGTRGVQAVVKQELKFVRSQPADRSAVDLDSFVSQPITFEFSDKSVSDVEFNNFDHTKFLNEICQNVELQGLTNEHSNNFRNLVYTARTLTQNELEKLYEESQGKCKLAGLTVSHAILFADTEEAFQAALSLLDSDAFSEQIYITEYPILTALARLQSPSASLLNRIRDYLDGKDASFAYLRKLYLVYSTLIRTHCNKNECSEDDLSRWTSIFERNLNNQCNDASKKDLVSTTLKAIGNVGSFNAELLNQCAANKEISLEARVNAIQAFRDFSCSKIASLTNILKDLEEDTEVRINAFLVLAKCADDQELSKHFEERLPAFLDRETDIQVLTFIVDYAKERGLTTLLNAVLSNQKVKERFSVNFKELSWNRYRYRHSFLRDGALETDFSVIYTPNTFLPRSIKFNVTLHMYGMSVNFIDGTLRMEGISDVLKGLLVDKLTADKLIEQLLRGQAEIISMLEVLADKLKYTSEKPSISLSLRVYGADVYFSELNTIENLRRLAKFLLNPREHLLYSQVKAIKNLFLIDSRVRQPLANGFEFDSLVDVSASLLISKASTKEDSEQGRDYHIQNFYSLSTSLNKKLEIVLNQDNKMSLKKKAFGNARVKLNVKGQKTANSKSYTVELPPLDQIALLTIDGRFYKLVGNTEYQEVKAFSVPTHELAKCTSDNFLNAFGVNLCFSVKRPAVGDLRDVFRSPDLNDPVKLFDDEEDDDDDEDHDHDDEPDRPRLSLSGPYHYDLVLKNPNNIKALVFEFNKEKSDRNLTVNGLLKTVNRNTGNVEERLALTYFRSRVDTNRAWLRNFDLQLKAVKTNDVRFKLAGEINYRKQETLKLNFVLDNKILREYRVEFDFLRQKDEKNIVPKYEINAVYDSNLLSDKLYKFHFDVLPNGRNINANLALDVQNDYTNLKTVRIVTGALSLSNVNKQSNVDYDVDLKITTFRQSEVRLYGKLAADLFRSNADLTFTVSRAGQVIISPSSVKLGHLYDGSNAQSSFVEVHANVPQVKVNHGVKLLFKIQPDPFKLNHLEVRVSTPRTGDAPYSVYYTKEKSTQGETVTGEYTVGIRNVNAPLDEANKVHSYLIKADGKNHLNSLTIYVKRVKNAQASSADSTLELRKNDVTFVYLNGNLQGNLDGIRKSDGLTLSKQSFSAGLKVKVFELGGALTTKVDLEADTARNFHNYQFHFSTDNLVKILLKISSVDSKFSLNNGALDAKFEMVKLGEMRRLKLTSNGNIRVNGDLKEFNVDYEKQLANGKTFKSAGVVKYRFSNFKNFDSKLDIKDFFNFRFSTENSRDADQKIGLHSYLMKYAHLDFEPTEREFKIVLQNKTEARLNAMVANILARRGRPGQADQVDYLFDLNTQNTFLNIKGERSWYSGVNSLVAKLTAFKVDLETKNDFKRDLAKKTLKLTGESKLNLPSFTEPGKTVLLKEKTEYNKNLATNARTVKYTFETDSKLIGKYFNTLNVDFVREIVDNVAKAQVNIVAVSNANGARKTIDIQTQSDCLTGSCKLNKMNVKQNLLSTYKTVSVSDCDLQGAFSREKTAQKYLLHVLASLECAKTKLINGEVFVTRDKTNNQPAYTHLRVDVSSLSWSRRYLELAHKKFSAQSGLVHLAFERGVKFSNKITYNRELNAVDKSLAKGVYTISTQLGSTASKVCELQIEKRNNYYNAFVCRMNTTFAPVEVSYGYALKINDFKELVFGKRSIELDVNVPGRTVRVEYNGHRSTPINQFDDDEDANNEREYNGTAQLYWDYGKDKSKVATINVKRDNYAPGKTRFTGELVNGKHFNSLKLEVNRERLAHETQIQLGISYELTNGKTNKLSVNGVMSSDLDSNKFAIETNLQRPSFNTLYQNKFNKHNGRLENLLIRVARLIQLNIEKDDPEQRKIYFELVNPDASKYQVSKQLTTKARRVHVVESSLSQAGDKLSQLISEFDADNNRLTVTVQALKSNTKYTLRFGLFNESLASVVLEQTNGQSVLVPLIGSLSVAHSDDFDNLVLNLRWNRFWKQMQEDILGASTLSLTERDNFNSYFGDVYATLSDELKPAHDFIRSERLGVFDDFGRFGGLLLDFYSNLFPSLRRRMADKMAPAENADNDDLPLYKRVFRRYNNLSKRLTDLHFKVRKYSTRLARYIPRLPAVTYNDESNKRDKSINPYDNNLVLTRPTIHSHNLYQFNAEYRDYLRRMADRVLTLKARYLRNWDGISTKALINKYKFRSFKDYTLVGHVFNRRNVIAFNGDATILKAKCQFLLTHELRNGEFSVVLNNQGNADQAILSVVVNGKSYDISANKAALDGNQVSLPHRNNENQVSITRLNNGVCFTLKGDLKVCCYEDSNSCTIGLTRWYVGRVNGLLGQANYNLESQSEEKWFLSSTCAASSAPLKKPSEEAVKTCYNIFGRHRRSFFRNAFQIVRPEGWRSVCEQVMTNKPAEKCALLKAFVHHAKMRSVEVDEPNECYKCQLQNTEVRVGDKVDSSLANAFENATDYAFVILPCGKSNSYSLESINEVVKRTFASSQDKYYIVAVSKNDASIYQTKDGQSANVDITKAYEEFASEDAEVEKDGLYKGLFLAGTLLTNRVAVNRRLVIVSCGNCLRYSVLNTLKLEKRLEDRNIIVSSWGKYQMADANEDEDNSMLIFGYNSDQVFTYDVKGKKVENELADSYKIEHEGDLCQRLAVKTEGNVFNIEKIREANVFRQTLRQLKERKPAFTSRIEKCERVDTPFGDVDDFVFSRNN